MLFLVSVGLVVGFERFLFFLVFFKVYADRSFCKTVRRLNGFYLERRCVRSLS